MSSVSDPATASDVRSDDALVATKVSPGALLLYRIIYGVANASPTGWCDYSHDDFAKEMGCNEKTVYRFLVRLLATGRIKRDRRGQGLTNLYRPLAGPPFIPKSARVSDPDQTTVSDPDQTTVSDPDQTTVSDPTCDNNKTTKSSSSSAAAAVEKNPEEKPVALRSPERQAEDMTAAVKALLAIPLTDAAGRPVAAMHRERLECLIAENGRSVQFIIDAAVPRLRAAFGQKRHGIYNPIGFIIKLFEDPENSKYRLVCEAGRWRWPPGESSVSSPPSNQAAKDRTLALIEESRRNREAVRAERARSQEGGPRS